MYTIKTISSSMHLKTSYRTKQHRNDVKSTSMRRHQVSPMPLRRHVPAGFSLYVLEIRSNYHI